ncbi:hypothetical protein GALL_530920 [mine drainage metagenome]|uniref:Uncharacterized protein n=1 Tax=mine drainage metagenome TaxID=410659 RepID=A0A1J5PC17_9ZZZZ
MLQCQIQILFWIGTDQCDTDACGAVMLEVAELVALTQRGEYLLAHFDRLRGGNLRNGTQTFQQHHEFITTQTGNRIAFAQARLQSLGHLLQQQVSAGMTDGVVEIFEFIQIDKQQGRLALTTHTGGNRLLQTVKQETPIGKAGQVVIKSELANLFGGRIASGDVA